MRAATLFVAVLCATLPAVYGRERQRTSPKDSPRPDKDGTRPGKTEDTKATGPIKQASSLCYGYQDRQGAPTAGEHRVCAIAFTPKGDKGCEANQLEHFVPDTMKLSSSEVKCSGEKVKKIALCYCGDEKCNANTEAMVQALGKWIKNKQALWIKDCPRALEQLERTPNVEKPTTGKPKNGATKPPKPASTPNDQSHAISTSDAPSGTDPKPTGRINQGASFCYGYQHSLRPPTSRPRRVCAIAFRPKRDGGCEAVPELFMPNSKEVSSSEVKCQNLKNNIKARCHCGGRECNADTNVISNALAKLVKKEGKQTTWLKNCPTALDQLEKTPEVGKEETPTTGKPKQDRGTTKPPKPASTPKHQPRAKSTSAAPSGPVPTPADPNSQESERCSGNLAFLDGVKGKGHPYCAYEFKKDDKNRCSAVPQERFVAERKDFSGSGSTLCYNADGGKIICLCEGNLCNFNKMAFLNKLKKLIGKDTKEESRWKQDCFKKLKQKSRKPKGSGDGKSTTPKVTEEPENTPEEDTATESPTARPSTDTTSIPPSAPGTETEPMETTTTPVNEDTVKTTTETTTVSPEAPTTTESEVPKKEPERTARPGQDIADEIAATVASEAIEAEATVETTDGSGIGGPISHQGSQGAYGGGSDDKADVKTGGGTPTWLLILLVIVALVVISLIIGGFIMYAKKKENKQEDIEGGKKAAAAAPPAPTVPVQSAPVVKAAPVVRQAAQKKNAPLPPQQPTLREQIMKEQWEQQLKLNAALDAAKKAPAVPTMPEVVPPKKEEEKGPMGGQVQVVDEQLPVLPTQEDISLKEAPKVEAVKAETSWKEKATQGTVDSVKTQDSESHKSEKKKKSSPPKELPKNAV